MDRNYEQEYKKAFEAAKGLHDAGNALTKKQMEIVFPELAESEDERIRKWIHKYIAVRLDDAGEFIGEYREALAWLEKQKEQKPVQSEVEREYVRTLKSLISDFIRGKEEVDREYYQQIFDWLDGRHIEQKPAEWSEEIIRKAVKEVGLTQHQIDWFKTNVFPPKVEWSEEDEDMLNSCISSIEEAKENRYAYKETDGDTSYDHEIVWLKSLRNRVGKESLQPHWKPTEEQMRCLKFACENRREKHNASVNGDAVFRGLTSLYNNLKKLM